MPRQIVYLFTEMKGKGIESDSLSIRLGSMTFASLLSNVYCTHNGLFRQYNASTPGALEW